MAIEAELADGRILEFPDGTDPSVVQATVKRVLASSQPAPQTTMLGGAKELFKGLVPGAVGLAESAAVGASALLPEDMEKSAREKIKSVATAAKAPFAAAPGYEESVPRKLGEAIGSTVPFLAAGPLGLAGRAAAAGLGVGAGAGEARTRAEAEGVLGEQRGTATALGTIPGAFEVFAPFRILGRLPDAVKAEGVVLARRALQAGGEEAAQEALSGFAQNLIARGIYKPEQALIEGLGEQAAYGGATGAIVQGLLDLAIGRRARGAQAPQEPTAPPVEPGPQLAPEAPAGTQGALFTPEEMGKPVRAPKAPEEPAATAVPEGQQDLGLDFQREYADLVQERERLKQQPQTPEVKARVQELTGQMALYTQSDIESMRAEKEGQAAAAAEDAAARKKFPALAEAPDLLTQPDEVKARTQGELFPSEDLAGPTLREREKPTAEPGEPTPVPPYARTGQYQKKLPLRGGEVAQPFTMQNVEDTGIAPSTTRGWFQQNVVGKTQAEVQALVDKDPTLLVGNGKRAKILRELLAPQAAPFKETPRVQPTPTPPPAIEPRDELGAGQPSVGVPSEPAPAKPAEPGAGVPSTAGAPSAPDGRGLVSAGRPAVQGDETAVGEPAAVEVETAEQEAARKAEAEDMRRRIEAAEKAKPAAPKAAPTPAPKAEKPAPKELPEKLREPVGTSEFGMEEGETEILRGPQGMLFPMSKREEAEYAKAKEAEAGAEEEAPAKPAKPAKDKRQMEIDFTKEPELEPVTPTKTPTPSDEATLKAIDGKPMLDVAQWASKNLPDPDQKVIAQRILVKLRQLQEMGVTLNPVKVTSATRRLIGAKGATELKGARTAGAPVTITITLNHPANGESSGTNPETILHELLHAATMGIIETGLYKSAEGTKVGTAARELLALKDAVVKHFNDRVASGTALTDFETRVYKRMNNAISDPHEVLVWAMTNREMQQYMETIPYKGQTAWNKFVTYVRDLLGVPAKADTALSEALRVGDTLLDLSKEDIAGAQAKTGKQYSAAARKPSPAYHSGDLKFGRDTVLGRMMGGRGTGHFGTGVYFVSSKDKLKDPFGVREGRPIQEVDFSKYNLFRPLTNYVAQRLHDGLRGINSLVERDINDQENFKEAVKKAVADLAYATDKDEKSILAAIRKNLETARDSAEKNAFEWTYIPTLATEVMQELGYEGVDVRGLDRYDDMENGSVIYGREVPADEDVQTQFQVSSSTESLINSMGPLEPAEKTGLKALIPSFKTGMSPAEPNYAVKFRTQVADSAATIEHRLREQFDGAVRDKLGKFNPMGLYRQAQDYSKMLLEYMQVGAISKEPETGLWKVKADAKVRPPVEVYALIDKWSAKNGYSRERGTQIASRILEGVRLDAMRTSNKNSGTSFLLHLKDPEIDQLVREYKADPELQAMSKAMDEARLAMVDNMVAVGRLSAEQGQVWKDAAGYVPFDRIEDFATSFNKIKKVSTKGLAQIGKLPELVGSINRPVGNVFDNYLNTLGWMVGQTIKTDGTVQTLRSLEDAGHAKYLGRSPQGKDNAVGMYVKGEMMYWELPSKYDVLAFKDLNPPKAKWLQILGQASNVLRKSVTVLPPFALKQVTDDVQRAIMTSGVKNPGALLRMTLSNFGGLALAELRGIQHPTVKEFGALGLTGEYDFQQGKPATSVLKDLGYKPRGKFETLIHRLDGITRASDLAVRKAIYEQTLKEGGDQLLAQTRAREFINFRRRGASDFVGAMVTTIPFFNAYIQGMDVLYRAASGKDSSSSVGRAQARRMFYSRAAMAMTLSTLYALGKGDDDEDYNEMELRVRDSNWILPGGFKLPVPTELGALFKVIPERIVEYMRRQGTPEEQEAWEATRTALKYIMEQYVESVVPVPQAVKPLLEAWTNYSFFTGRELEGIYQKQQDPSLRRASNTSELAIAIANFSKDVVGVDKVSPIMVDNALNGYFGSTAGLLVAVTDSLLNPTRVDRPLHKYALISNYMYDPVGTRRMTEFYDEREKVGRANTTLAELMKTDLDKAAEYAEKNADKLMMESAVNSTLEQLERTRAYKKYLNGKLAAEDMTSDERADQIKEIRQMEVELTSWLREAKAAIRQ